MASASAKPITAVVCPLGQAAGSRNGTSRCIASSGLSSCAETSAPSIAPAPSSPARIRPTSTPVATMPSSSAANGAGSNSEMSSIVCPAPGSCVSPMKPYSALASAARSSGTWTAPT